MNKTLKICSFCGKNNSDESMKGKMVEGQLPPESPKSDFKPTICIDCATDVLNLLKKKESQANASTADSEKHKTLTPSQIRNHLDDYICGQDNAKKVIAVAIYNHFKRIQNDDLNKANILIAGPTGTGKTLFAETIAKILDIPYAVVDATTITEAGYVGEDVEMIIKRLLDKADGDISRAEKGIVYIDEIDKIRKVNAGSNLTKDVSGEGVQQALLKLIEGSEVNVPDNGSRKHSGGSVTTVNTKDILFIVGGSFAGIETHMQTKLAKQSYGVVSKPKGDVNLAEIYENIDHEHLISFGMIPEFMGRFPNVVGLSPMTLDDLKKIITEPKNSIIKEYTALISSEGISVSFAEEYIEHLAKTAIDKKIGARGVRTMLESELNNFMFILPDIKEQFSEIVITSEFLKEINNKHFPKAA